MIKLRKVQLVGLAVPLATHLLRALQDMLGNGTERAMVQARGLWAMVRKVRLAHPLSQRGLLLDIKLRCKLGHCRINRSSDQESTR